MKVDVIGIEPEHRNAVRIRIVFAALSALFAFLTLQLNPISIATTLTFTSPIFTSIFAFLAIGERITRYDFLNIFGGIVGVILITNPFSDIEGNTTLIGVVVGILAAITVAGSFTMVRITAINMHFLIPMFYYGLATTAFAPIGYLVLFTRGHTPAAFTYDNFIRIGVLGLLGFGSQFFLSASYKFEKAARVSNVRYLQVVLSFLVDVMLFKTSFSPEEILGAVGIIVSNLAIVILKCTGKIS